MAMVIKDICEICGFIDKRALHLQHMIPRTDKRSTNFKSNLACICSNCHNLVHAGEIIIEGRFLTSAGNKLFWHKKDSTYYIREGIFLQPDGTADVRN